MPTQCSATSTILSSKWMVVRWLSDLMGGEITPDAGACFWVAPMIDCSWIGWPGAFKMVEIPS